MKDINRVVLVGRLTRDCEKELPYTKSGVAKATIGLAVNNSAKINDEWVDEVSFIEVVIWGKMAESLKQYLVKGKQVSIDGYIKQDRWEKDGNKFSKIYIVADSVQLLGGSGNSTVQNNSNVTNSNLNNQRTQSAQTAQMYNNYQEEIPF